MTIVVLNHKVKDFKTWKPFYDADSLRRNDAGLKELYVASSASDPNDVHIAFETNDFAKAQKFMESPDLQKVMEQAGVISEPKITVLQKA
jgi:hypothetical protein